MSFEQSRLRSDMIGTQVITRSTGRRLGVVSQLWVDIDRCEVVALGLRDNILSKVVSGPEQIMLLSSIRQIGDVILVDDAIAAEQGEALAAYAPIILCTTRHDMYQLQEQTYITDYIMLPCDEDILRSKLERLHLL